jgi:hypothetical protein
MTFVVGLGVFVDSSGVTKVAFPGAGREYLADYLAGYLAGYLEGCLAGFLGRRPSLVASHTNRALDNCLEVLDHSVCRLCDIGRRVK